MLDRVEPTCWLRLSSPVLFQSNAMVTGGSGLHGVPVPEVVTKARKYAEENAIIRHHRMEESRVKDHQDIQLFACSHDAVLVS
jgi:hypothetical protein